MQVFLLLFFLLPTSVKADDFDDIFSFDLKTNTKYEEYEPEPEVIVIDNLYFTRKLSIGEIIVDPYQELEDTYEHDYEDYED